MSGSVVTSHEPLLQWRFPELEMSPEPRSAPAPSEAGRGGGAAVESGQDNDRSGEYSVDKMLQEQLASGYAAGFELGRTEGRDKGYADGVAEGQRAGQERLAAQSRRLAHILDRLAAPITGLERLVEEAVVALALELARCVIGGETARSREHLVRLIREAIAKVPIEMGALRVVLSPVDLELIRTLAPEIENANVSLIGDRTVEPGGCLVVADGQGAPLKDMRWQQRSGQGMSQVDLTLASRWRSVMLTLFEGEEK